MKNRNNKTAFFIFILLIIIAVFQYLNLQRSAKINDKFQKLVNNLEIIGTSQAPQPNRPSDSFYPGDEGDWLIWAFNTEPKTLNALSVERDIYTVWMTQNTIFEPLLNYDFNTLELVPHLAESFDVSSDGLEITFTLRDDIYFSDGVKITTDDVLFTYQTIVDPKIDISDLANQFIDVKDVIKVSGRVIKFKMKRVYFKSLETVSLWNVGVFPKHVYEYDDPAVFNSRVSDPVGSGPYVFEKWNTGDSVTLKRNENYWAKKPNIRKLVYKFISNDVARAQALRSGKVDMIVAGPEQYADLTAEEGFTDNYTCLDYWTPLTPYFYIGWNMRTPFFEDSRVRLAMTHIIDRENIVSALLKDNAAVINGPFYFESDAYDKDVKTWPYDLEKARNLLDQAGWIDTNGNGIRDKDGLEFSFKFTISSGNRLYDRIASMLKDSAAKVGIEVKIDPVEWSLMMVKLNARDFHAMSAGWGGDVEQDPYQLWHSSQSDNRGSNYCGFKDPEVDRLIEKGRRTLDDNERNKFYRKIHRIVHRQQPYTFLYARPTFRIIDKRFENTKVYPMGLNYLEWYVPKNKQKYK